MPEFEKPPQLNIKCTSADCENELHCFKRHCHVNSVASQEQFFVRAEGAR